MKDDAENVVGLYQRHGLAWAKDRGNRLHERAWLDRFSGLLPPMPQILDIGCGSGEPIARYLIEQSCALTGVDSSPDLVGASDGVAIGAYAGEPLYHASLHPTEYRELLIASGFDVMAHEANDATCGGRTIWIAQLR